MFYLSSIKQRISYSLRKNRQRLALLVSAALLSSMAFAQAEPEVGTYPVNAGDVLQLQVWNEPTLSAEQVLVRPDGFISVPVVGEIRAGGRNVDEIRQAVVAGLNRYLKDEPTVVISVLNTGGSEVYVLGKVQRPGAFPLRGPLDVTQALAMAGGLNSFAAENKIKVLRRDAQGVQRAIKFRYGEVRGGDKLESNILLHSGDVVLVP